MALVTASIASITATPGENATVPISPSMALWLDQTTFQGKCG